MKEPRTFEAPFTEEDLHSVEQPQTTAPSSGVSSSADFPYPSSGPGLLPPHFSPLPAHPRGPSRGLPRGAVPDTEKEIISIITNSILSTLLCENNLLLSQPRGQGDRPEAQGIVESQAN